MREKDTEREWDRERRRKTETETETEETCCLCCKENYFELLWKRGEIKVDKKRQIEKQKKLAASVRERKNIGKRLYNVNRKKKICW